MCRKNLSVVAVVKEQKEYIMRKEREKRNERETYLASAFKKINSYLEDLFGMVNKKTGFWIFTSHKYSAKKILKSEQYRKIESYVDKIGDDITNWEKNGELDGSIRHTYNVNRDALEFRIVDLKSQIEKREPTWWDKVKDFFVKAVKWISEKLPKILKGLLSVFNVVAQIEGPIGDIGKWFAGLGEKVSGLLLPKEKHYITH